MQIICISRGTQSKGVEFAENLAAKLGYECLSREDILEEATRQRIPIGKLETTIIKPHLFGDKLAMELEHYKALATNILCEKALKNSIVYHGRTGHLLLPGVNHILKLRVISDMEYRIKYVMEKMQLTREKAKFYINQIDEDRKKWVKTFYNIQWDVNNLYDLIINLNYMNLKNAATAMCSLSQLPEFQATPSSVNVLKDLYLESHARMMLFSDRRTESFHIRIKASNGIIYITYPIQLADKIKVIDDVLLRLEDLREIVYTKAQTNILWIQEKFNVQENIYNKVLSIAKTWDAAVELLQLAPSEIQELVAQPEQNVEPEPETWRNTGIISDDEQTNPEMSKDMLEVYENLIRDGRAGGYRSITGTKKTLINSIDKTANYKLIIFDNVFLSKGAAARKRTLQEWANSITELILTPVVNLEELVFKYHFSSKHITQLIINGFLSILSIFLIFNFSRDIIKFISEANSEMRIITTACIMIFVPVFALFYGKTVGLLLKLIKFE